THLPHHFPLRRESMPRIMSDLATDPRIACSSAVRQGPGLLATRPGATRRTVSGTNGAGGRAVGHHTVRWHRGREGSRQREGATTLSGDRPGRRCGRKDVSGSLDLDARAHALELLLGLVGGLLVDLLENRLRRVVHQLLGLLQTQRGQLTHDLDDLDLLVAGARSEEHTSEL